MLLWHYFTYVHTQGKLEASQILPCIPDNLGTQMVKESACNAEDLGSIPGLGRSPKEWHSNPLQCSCLENTHGQRSLAGYHPWGCKELYMTERLSIAHEREDRASQHRS